MTETNKPIIPKTLALYMAFVLVGIIIIITTEQSLVKLFGIGFLVYGTFNVTKYFLDKYGRSSK